MNAADPVPGSVPERPRPPDVQGAAPAPPPVLDTRWTGELARLETMREVVDLVKAEPGLYVRFSAGPEADAGSPSRDGESGCLLPGLSVNRLAPEPWWTRPVDRKSVV